MFDPLMPDPATRQQPPFKQTALLAILLGSVGALSSTSAATAQSVAPVSSNYRLHAVPVASLTGNKAIAPVTQPVAEPVVEFSNTSSSTLQSEIHPPLASEQLIAQSDNSSIAQQTPEASLQQQLQQRLLQLEQRQQELEQEIQQLRQELEGSNSPTVDEPTAATPPAEDPQTFSVTAEALILRPSTSSLQDFAIIGEDRTSAFVADGDIVGVDYGTSLGMRLTARYDLPSSPLDVAVRYSTFAVDGDNRVTRDANGVLLATLSNPSQNESAISASADTGINYSVTDLELGYRLNVGDRNDVRLFGGVTIADIQQDLRVRYDGDDFDRSLVSINRNFTGYGLRLGGQANIGLGGDFSLFGRASGSLLLGDFYASQRETNENGRALIVELDRTLNNRIVPAIELAAGLQWETQISSSARLAFATGYELQNWFNLVDAARLTDNAGQGVLSQDTNDLSIHGFFIRAGVQFEF